jgi:phytoene dehydrogenase-like protein
MSKLNADVVVVGAGHNGLVAAVFLARQGLDVVVLEDKPKVGGAAKTEYPFAKAPLLGQSTGAYLLGMVPPELLQKIGVDIEMVRRDPHYFLPTLGSKYLMFGSDRNSTRRQFLEFFSEQDWRADEALNAEIAALREDLAPSWMEEPLSIDATAERYIRPALRKAFLDLMKRPLEEYFARFEFQSELLPAMYGVTDGFSGLNASFDAPAGFNFLLHNMCRLPGSDGTFMIAKGGMGAVTRALAGAAVQAGARILTDSRVERIIVTGGQTRGVALADGREITASTVVVNADPFRMLKMVGDAMPEPFASDLRSKYRDGTTMKVNLALKGLPKFRCLPEDKGQFGSTIHLLPMDDSSGRGTLEKIKAGYRDVRAGKLADFPTIEWYIHTTVDPTLRDGQGHHNSAFFVQWVPYSIAGSSWEQEEERYVKHLLSIADRFAPGFSDLVVDHFTLTPPKIEKHFGITGGHIHHVDNTYVMDQRMPYATPVAGLYSCSAGCHPGGGMIGTAGHNSAQRVIRDLGA